MDNLPGIGSDFCELLPIHAAKTTSAPASHRYYVAGRTALHAILQDICTARPCKTALLPSYCCGAMIMPFLRLGLSVSFYQVIALSPAQISLPAEGTYDIVLCMDYFGFDSGIAEMAASAYPGSTIIQDMSHSILRQAMPLPSAHYAYASYHKWGALSGAALAVKQAGPWLTPAPTLVHTEYAHLRQRAMAAKRDSLASPLRHPASHRKRFALAADVLCCDYTGYAADAGSVAGIQAITGAGVIRRRRANAKQLQQALAAHPFFMPVYGELQAQDCPLCFPIRVPASQRSAAVRHLIAGGIYTPVHWPITPMHHIAAEARPIYEEEISLICDQRYGQADMQRQLDVLLAFEGANDG